MPRRGRGRGRACVSAVLALFPTAAGPFCSEKQAGRQAKKRLRAGEASEKEGSAGLRRASGFCSCSLLYGLNSFDYRSIGAGQPGRGTGWYTGLVPVIGGWSVEALHPDSDALATRTVVQPNRDAGPIFRLQTSGDLRSCQMVIAAWTQARWSCSHNPGSNKLKPNSTRALVTAQLPGIQRPAPGALRRLRIRVVPEPSFALSGPRHRPLLPHRTRTPNAGDQT
ncbi:hypothetical protein DENSPDRAFT_494115 [Dentipellis sp. KUC8613]|nr:hypothetical protein DENSPDRAFT_494115 [Dentipellis sp. KUC8613]